ncbi:MAG: LPS export ABC transporter periplasmic protein LptC [Syntrophales bacterium LBB04]|nr:LPS export ABC transporter periplasmic protein LptC [Syntrophales bacterium LBB04]
MSSQKRTFIIAGVGLVLIMSALLILFLKIFSPVSPETMLKIMSNRADLEVRNVLYREVGADDTKWEIRARKASYLMKDNQAVFDQVEVKFFLSDGAQVVLAGDKGQLNTATNDMDVSGNVGITSGQDDHFTTDYLQYSAAEKKFHTKGAVVLENTRMRTEGVGMSFSLMNKEVVLLSRVHAKIKMVER